MARFYFRPGHPKASALGFVSSDDLGDDVQPEPELAVNAGIMSGRFYENTGKAHDGTPINSRKDYREYQKRTGVTQIGDFKETWAKAAKEREQHRQGGTPAERRERREDLARALHRR